MLKFKKWLTFINFFFLIFLLFIFNPQLVYSDSRVGLEEAIHSLQVVAGIRPNGEEITFSGTAKEQQGGNVWDYSITIQLDGVHVFGVVDISKDGIFYDSCRLNNGILTDVLMTFDILDKNDFVYQFSLIWIDDMKGGAVKLSKDKGDYGVMDFLEISLSIKQ